MRVFVTGATGWVGSASCRAAQERPRGRRPRPLRRLRRRSSSEAGAGVRNAATSTTSTACAQRGRRRRRRRPLAFKHDLDVLRSGAEAGPRRRPPRDPGARRHAGGLRQAAGRHLGHRCCRGQARVDGGRRGRSRRPRAAAVSAASSRRARRSTATSARSSSASRRPSTAPSTTASSRRSSRASRAAGVAGYVGDGANRWAAVHRSDAARPLPPRAGVRAGRLGPARGRRRGRADPRHRGGHRPRARRCRSRRSSRARPPSGSAGSAGLFSLDIPSSAVRTLALLGWEPSRPGLLEDLAGDSRPRGAGRRLSRRPPAAGLGSPPARRRRLRRPAPRRPPAARLLRRVDLLDRAHVLEHEARPVADDAAAAVLAVPALALRPDRTVEPLLDRLGRPPCVLWPHRRRLAAARARAVSARSARGRPAPRSSRCIEPTPRFVFGPYIRNRVREARDCDLEMGAGALAPALLRLVAATCRGPPSARPARLRRSRCPR